jgi:adenylate kinase
VDEGVLLKRIKKRIAEMKARGEMLREDDDPEVLRRRLSAYRDQTAPLVTYYQLQSVLRSVDGMTPIPEVSSAIDRVLRKAGTKKTPVKGSAASGPAAKARANRAAKPAKGHAKMAKSGVRKGAAGKAARRKSRSGRRLTKRR